MRDERSDWLDKALTQAPQWEPPSGFALRATAAARQHQTPTEPSLQRQRLFLASWWRDATVEAVRSRLESSVWVLRQYRSLFER
jgi:hypothetical protein